MPPPPWCAGRYSASSSWCRHSPARPLAMCERGSCGFLQRRRAAHGSRELTVDLRARLRRIARRKAIQHLAEVFLGQVLVGVLPDQHHRRVHAGAETLDFFPGEIAVLRQMEGIVVNPALTHVDDITRAPEAARRGAADLDMGF